MATIICNGVPCQSLTDAAYIVKMSPKGKKRNTQFDSFVDIFEIDGTPAAHLFAEMCDLKRTWQEYWLSFLG